VVLDGSDWSALLSGRFIPGKEILVPIRASLDIVVAKYKYPYTYRE
jgi:hypothetical protein